MALQTAACLGLFIKGRLSGLAVSRRTDVSLKARLYRAPRRLALQWIRAVVSVDLAHSVCLMLPMFVSDGLHGQSCLPHSQCTFNFDSFCDKYKGSIPPHLSCPLHSSPASHILLPGLFTRMNFRTFKTNRQWNWCQAHAVVLWAHDGEKHMIFQACCLSLAVLFGVKGTCRDSEIGTSRALWEYARIPLSALPLGFLEFKCRLWKHRALPRFPKSFTDIFDDSHL